MSQIMNLNTSSQNINHQRMLIQMLFAALNSVLLLTLASCTKKQRDQADTRGNILNQDNLTDSFQFNGIWVESI